MLFRIRTTCAPRSVAPRHPGALVWCPGAIWLAPRRPGAMPVTKKRGAPSALMLAQAVKGRSILLVERIKTNWICRISIRHRHPSSLWNQCILVEHMGLMLHRCNSPWPSCCAECPAVLCLGTGILPREFRQIEALMAWTGKDHWIAGCTILAPLFVRFTIS